MTARATVQFLGAAGTVTGSMHLVRVADRRVLLDCGLFQGLKELRVRNWSERVTDPRTLDAVVLSHAHIDHTGYLPVLARQGFRGPIFCTPTTGDLLGVMLRDSAHLQEEEAERANRHAYSKHRPALPLYTVSDALQALELVEHRPYAHPFPVCEGVTALVRRAGHIMGAGTVDLELGHGNGRRLVFSGDLGRWDQPLLRDPESVTQADVLLLESTYGDREHPTNGEAELTRIVNQATERGGALLIPAFAVGRAQELVWWLDQLERAGQIPSLPLYLDSPMAIDATDIYTRHPEDHPSEVHGRIGKGGHLTHGKRCLLARSVEESKRLNGITGPVIIIAASGMATGGRILHHLAHRLPDPRTTVLLVGFQAAGTRGRALRDGAPSVRMFGRDVPVRATVETIEALSAHGDRQDLLRWLGGFTRPPRQTYLVHGEPAAADSLAAAIRERYGWTVDIARDGETVDIA